MSSVRLLRDLAVAGLVLALLAAAIALYLSATTIAVRNQSNETLTSASIGFTGKELWRGDLEAGNSKWVFGMPIQDGGVEVSYSIRTARHDVTCGYVSPGPMGTSFVVDILPNGQSRCAQDD